MKPTLLATALLLAAAGCSKPVAENVATSNVADITDNEFTEVPDETAGDVSENAAEPSPHAVDAWNGKWVGVEGLALTISPGETPETRKLVITLLDGTNTYVGTVNDKGIAFDRAGKTETIHAGNGAETGLKYLSAKKNCLIIKSSEGFCRD